MKKTVKQYFSLFLAMRGKQKIIYLSTLLFLILFFFLIFRPFTTEPLFPHLAMTATECKESRELLEKNGIACKQKRNQIYISGKKLKRAESLLQGEGLLKKEKGGGFELFDTNTWIKGEKELAMLEVRALKGQLEKDIAGFDNIKEARVILDLSPQKLFGGSRHQTKASVILTLEEHAELTSSNLRAITYHLSGAVRGLLPNMIAISDTSGMLYKAIRPEGEDELLLQDNKSTGDLLTEKITKLMNKMVGRGNFHLTLSMTEEMTPLACALMIANSPAAQENRQSIENQLRTLFVGFAKEPVISIDFATFKNVKEPTAPTSFRFIWPYMGIALFLLLAAGFFLFIHDRGDAKQQESIDVSLLADRIKGQEPKIIALMFSYLELEKAEELLAALPYDVQKQVALHLGKLEERG